MHTDNPQQEKVCIDIQGNHHIDVRPPNLSDEDVNNRGTPSDVSGKRDLQLLVDLSITPHGMDSAEQGIGSILA